MTYVTPFFMKRMYNVNKSQKNNRNWYMIKKKQENKREYKKEDERGAAIMKELNMNLELYEKSVKESEKPVLVEFWAPWCVYCRRIAPAYDKIAEQYADKLVVGKINVDDVPEAAAKEKIEAIPALLLYKGGEVIGSIVAPDSKAKIEAFIEEHL